MRPNITILLGAAAIACGLHREAEAPPKASNQHFAIVAPFSIDKSPEPSSAPCPETLRRDEAEPLNPGPARLVTIRCLNLARGQDQQLPPVVSPNGQSVALWGSGQVSPLDVIPLDGSSGFRLANRVTFRNFGFGIDDRQDALAWRSDGSGLWSVEQKVMRPNGWALSGLTPILIDRAGSIRRFALPEHAAGPLDALTWVGGNGRAIVQFGTRGDRYRPEHDDPSPTLAMIDVPSRRILHTLTARDAEALRLRAGSYNGFSLFDVSVVQLRNGRLRALLQLQRVVDRSRPPASTTDPAEDRFLPAVWLVWTQGERPAPITPLFDDRFARAEFTPDGSRILVWRALQPDGWVIHDCRNCPPPPPPTPITAPMAALIDVRNGRTIWSLKARASQFWNRFGGPVISPTGKFALVPLPAANQRQIIALLSMKNGQILQRFSLGCSGCYPQSFGFTAEGTQMWIGISNRLAFYDFR